MKKKGWREGFVFGQGVVKMNNPRHIVKKLIIKRRKRNAIKQK